jgi:hypothetical protein
MRTQLLCSRCSFVGLAFLAGVAACSSKASNADAGHPPPDSGNPQTDAPPPSCEAGAADPNYVLIDDMETTTHGPILLTTGIALPMTQGYWYNSGASYPGDGGVPKDTSNPPQMAFVFTPVPSATNTLNCKPSTYAARQSCSLSGLYDTCGVGFEFAQLPDVDAGAPPDPSPDAANVPRYTVPFDISRYKAVTFWGMTTTPDPDTEVLAVKMSFPDTDTDPRGEVCNGGGGNTSKCYNSYAANLKFTTSWQQFTVQLDNGDGGAHPIGGIAIDPTWGYQGAQWLPTQVYGINWQAQRNTNPEDGPPLMTDIWIDDVYFVQ